MAADAQFESLLAYLKRSRGFDFGAYKRTGLVRRVQKRLHAVGAENYAEYLDYLEVHPDEFGELFNTILINVTGFFRDPAAWEFVAETVIPAICQKDETESVRVWSCGCASGEEAYTLAMLLAERVGRKAFRERVKVYATDADPEALEQARQATYALKQVQDVPEELLAKYFERTARGFVFDKELRRSVIFGGNDLVHDAPISRLDLLVCRNTLMYFNAEAQNRILSRFHFALNDKGYLFLGKAELLLTHGHLFTPVEMKRRIFVKVPSPARRERALPPNGDGDGDGGDQAWVRLRQVASNASPVGEVLMDLGGRVASLNARARLMLGLSAGDGELGLASADIANRVPGIRRALDDARTELRPVVLRAVECHTQSGDGALLDIEVVPLMQGPSLAGLCLFMTDAGRVKRLQEELSSARQELEATNEELQSANEELETTNEELQSTNEELETMNEELQSTNEELHTVNEELRQRSDALHESNVFLESVLTGLRSGVVVVDTEMHVTAWNRRAEDLWGLRREEVRGKHLLNLDIGLPVDKLKQPIRACLAGDIPSQDLTISATNRRGRTIECEVLVTPLGSKEPGIRGVILLMQER